MAPTKFARLFLLLYFAAVLPAMSVEGINPKVYDQKLDISDSVKTEQILTNHLKLYAGLSQAEDQLLPIDARLEKAAKIQSELIQRKSAQTKNRFSLVKQDAVNFALEASIQELTNPTPQHKIPPNIAGDVKDSLTAARIFSARAFQTMKQDRPPTAIKKNQADALFHIQQALQKLQNSQKNNENSPPPQGNGQGKGGNNGNTNAQDNQPNNAQDNGQTNQNAEDGPQSQPDNNGQTAQNDPANTASPRQNQQDGKGSDSPDALNSPSGQSPANNGTADDNGVNQALSQNQNKSEIAKYEEYKKQEQLRRLKRLGISEEESRRFLNPRLPVEKDW